MTEDIHGAETTPKPERKVTDVVGAINLISEFTGIYHHPTFKQTKTNPTIPPVNELLRRFPTTLEQQKFADTVNTALDTYIQSCITMLRADPLSLGSPGSLKQVELDALFDIIWLYYGLQGEGPLTSPQIVDKLLQPTAPIYRSTVVQRKTSALRFLAAYAQTPSGQQQLDLIGEALETSGLKVELYPPQDGENNLD